MEMALTTITSLSETYIWEASLTEEKKKVTEGSNDVENPLSDPMSDVQEEKTQSPEKVSFLLITVPLG